MRCGEHALAFTAYPAGHVPYGQIPVLDLALDGTDPDWEDSEDRFTGTSWAAPVDAAKGVRWPRDSAPDPGLVRSSQRRQLHRGAMLLGLVASALEYEVAAEVLDLPGRVIAETTSRMATARSLVAKGAAVKGVLDALTRRSGQWLMDRLAVLGHLAGLWGRPFRWRPGPPGRLLPLGRPFWPKATNEEGPRGPP